MREIVSLHIGQAGCGVGFDMWNSFAREAHTNGDESVTNTSSEPNKSKHITPTFFNPSSSDVLVPRAVFVDNDPMQETSFLRFRVSGLHQLTTDQLLCSKRDARSVYHAGRKEARESGLVDSAVEKLIDQAESCDNIGGFLVQRSIGGGTGSAVGDMILSRLKDEFPKTVILETLIYPSREASTSPLEPFNTILSLAASRSTSSLSLVLDNQSAYRISKTKLGVSEPSFFDMNSFIARVVSNCTASLRFPSTLNSSLGEIVTNLVPDPVLRYGIVSMAPLTTDHSTCPSAKDLVSALFHSQSYLCEVPNIRDNPNVAACIQCHGSVPLANLQKSIQTFRSSAVRNPVRFAPWISTSFKVGLVNSTNVPAATLLSNSTAVAVPFSEQLLKYKSLLTSRKFLWHYMENGAELDEFDAATNSVLELISAYESVTSACNEESTRLQVKRIEKISM